MRYICRYADTVHLAAYSSKAYDVTIIVINIFLFKADITFYLAIINFITFYFL